MIGNDFGAAPVKLNFLMARGAEDYENRYLEPYRDVHCQRIPRNQQVAVADDSGEFSIHEIRCLVDQLFLAVLGDGICLWH